MALTDRDRAMLRGDFSAHDPDLFLETSDGTGQYAGALNVGMLGLCGPDSRARALARLAERDAPPS